MSWIALLSEEDLPQSASTQHIIDRPTGVDAVNADAGGAQASATGDSLTGATDVTTSSPNQSVSTPLAADAVTGLVVQGAPISSTGAGAALDRQLYIIFLDGEIRRDQAALASRAQQLLGAASAEDLLEHLNGFSARLTAAQALRLQRSQGVISVEADRAVSLVSPISEADPASASGGSVSANAAQVIPWGITKVWGSTKQSQIGNTNPGTGSYAMVLDTGVSTATNDLIIDSFYSRNFTSTKTSDWMDYNGHGTHVSGTIAAVNDSDGVVGVAPGATIISIRVLDRRGSGQLSWVLNGINYAASLASGALKGKKLVANMSLGASGTSLNDAIRNAASQSLPFAVAAGNSGADVDGYTPASAGDHAYVYTVSAIGSDNRMTSWSNYENKTETSSSTDDSDYSAPGLNIESLSTSGSIATMSGTSMASPHMAGVLLMGGPISSNWVSTPYNSNAAGDPLALLS